MNHSNSIKSWPTQERPREKLLDLGAQALSDAELLAILLRSGTRKLTAIDLARLLLTHFGGLSALLHAPISELMDIDGMGPAKATQLKSVAALAQRQLKQEFKKKTYLHSSKVTQDYLRLCYQHIQNEVFSCIFLDTQLGVLAIEDLFVGSINQSHVYPREVVARCLQHGASAVIFAHNHPSGICEPSQADIAITQRLTKALEMIDIRVLDHLIIGEEIFSFADKNLL